MRVRRAHVKSCARGGGVREHGGRRVYWQKGGTLRGLLSGCYKRWGRLAFLDRCRSLRYRVIHRLKAWHGCIGKKGAPYAAFFRGFTNVWGVSRSWTATDR